MSKTTFSIEFINNIDNCSQISFTDLSSYNPDVEIQTPIIKILYPDFQIAESLIYTPRSINIIQVPTGDGLYTLELSVCPNNKIKKVFYYFQLCQAMNTIKTQLCKYSGNLEKVNKIMDIYKYALATQMVAITEPEKAKVMYKYIQSQLNC